MTTSQKAASGMGRLLVWQAICGIVNVLWMLEGTLRVVSNVVGLATPILVSLIVWNLSVPYFAADRRRRLRLGYIAVTIAAIVFTIWIIVVAEKHLDIARGR
ncbi:MAG: hypothetical protein KatS3mg104_2503 [Phycisphaerae bacterium]|nr:MAG: hypothetical protein KatS3mg104_2503 [Phycisphaerae bacterium]